VPVGVLIFETGAAISSAELNRLRRRSRSFRRNCAVTRTRALASSKLYAAIGARRSGWYTSAVTHKRCSRIASFLATATTARFF
jgi:hypothetical protein